MSALYTIYTFGGGDIITEVLNGVAAAVGDSAFNSALRLAALFGVIWAVGTVLFKNHFMPMLKWMGVFYLLYNLMLVPKMEVAVVDELNNQSATVVANVPVGLGFFAGTASSIGYFLTQLCDKVFSLPDDVSYSHTGLVMGSRLVSTATRFQITDPTFAQNINNFVQQCVFYDVLLHKYPLDNLYNAPNLWAFVTQNASPARAFAYTKDNQTTIVTCQTGVNSLQNDWQTEIKQAPTVYGKRLYGDNADAASELLSRLPTSFNYLTGISASATDIMQQAMLANALRNAIATNGATASAPAAVQQFAESRSEQLLTSKFILGGALSGYWLTIMQVVINALLYGSFLILVLVMLLPTGWRVISSYVQTLIWVQLWPPLYAVLNLVMTMGAESQSHAAVSTLSQSAVTLSTYAGLAKVNADIAAFAGYASLAIPLISWGIVKFTAPAVTALASNILSATQQAVARGGEDMSSGNISMGNVQLDNTSGFNTSDFHDNQNALYQSGMMSYQTDSGAMIHHTGDGQDVIDSRNAISNTGTNVNLADAMREAATQSADRAYNESMGHSEAYSTALSSAYRSMYELSQAHGQSASSDSHYGTQESASIHEAASVVQSNIDRFARDHGLSVSEATSLVANAGAGVGISAKLDTADLEGGLPGGVEGVSASAGAKLGFQGSMSGSAQDSSSYRDAQELSQQADFRDAVDTLSRASHDENYRTGQDESSRLMNNIGESLDAASSARQEMNASQSEANSYREAASFATDNSVAINTNQSQEFVNWLSGQAAPDGGTLGISGAEHILNSEPELANAYANQFVQGEVDTLASKVHDSGLTDSADAVSQAGDADAHSLSQASTMVGGAAARGNTVVASEAKQVGVSHSHVSQGAMTHSNQISNQDDMTLSDREAQVQNQAKAQKLSVTETQKDDTLLGQATKALFHVDHKDN